MNKELAEYLTKMSKKISNKDVRQKVIEEMTTHFFDEIEALMEQGETYQDAVDIVLGNATDPKKLGYKLNLAHRPFYLRYPLTLWMTSISLLTFVLLVLVSHFIMNETQEIFAKNMMHEKVYEDFFKDMRDLEKFRDYKIGHQSNAHEFLASHIDLFSWNQAQSDHGDLNWVDRILIFDHWNFYEDKGLTVRFNEVSKSSPLERLKLTSSYYIPNMYGVQKIIEKRVRSLIKSGEITKAEILWDHSFSLFMSTHTMVGGLVAANSLRLKNKIKAELNLVSWNSVSLDKIKLYRRIPYGWAGVISDLSLRRKYLAQLQKYLKPQFGACMGVTEQLAHIPLLEGFFEKKYPMEPDYNLELTRLRNVYRPLLEDCGLKKLYKVSTSLEGSMPWVMDLGLFYLPVKYRGRIPFINLLKLPYIRSIFGAYIHTVAIPHYSTVYTREKSKR